MKKWWIASLSLLTTASLVGELAGPHGHRQWWTAIPGFFIYFGFFGCILLIVFAKNLGRLLLNRDEDYYDK
jgi:hypothetical protein